MYQLGLPGVKMTEMKTPKVERRKAEEALHQGENCIRELAENFPEVVWMCDAEVT